MTGVFIRRENRHRHIGKIAVEDEKESSFVSAK